MSGQFDLASVFLAGLNRVSAKKYKFSPFPLNFDNKNAIKRVTPCKFLCQIIFCNVEFAQNCRKFEFSGEKIEFHGKKSSFAIFGQNEFPSKRTKNKPASD